MKCIITSSDQHKSFLSHNCNNSESHPVYMYNPDVWYCTIIYCKFTRTFESKANINIPDHHHHQQAANYSHAAASIEGGQKKDSFIQTEWLRFFLSDLKMLNKCQLVNSHKSSSCCSRGNGIHSRVHYYF